jgi:phage FluMu protein Com
MAATARVEDGFRTVRCENDRCRHIVFRYAREDAALTGGVVIEVKCRCKTMNKVRILPAPARTTT